MRLVRTLYLWHGRISVLIHMRLRSILCGSGNVEHVIKLVVHVINFFVIFRFLSILDVRLSKRKALHFQNAVHHRDTLDTHP